MAISHQTATSAVAAMRRHCTDEQLEKVLKDFGEIPGSRSWRETVTMLQREHDYQKRSVSGGCDGDSQG